MERRTREEMMAVLSTLCGLIQQTINKGLMWGLDTYDDGHGLWFSGHVKTADASIMDDANCHCYWIYDFNEPEVIEEKIKAIKDFIVKH